MTELLEPEPTYVLSLADLALVSEARQAFRTDYHYLEQVLWAARIRSEGYEGASPRLQLVKSEPELKPEAVAPPPLEGWVRQPPPEWTDLDLERVVNRVEIDASGCWVWLTPTGERALIIPGRAFPMVALIPQNPGRPSAMSARRYMWELHHGLLPSTKARCTVPATCDPGCVSPEHVIVMIGHGSGRRQI